MDYEKLHKNTLAALQQMVSEGKITEKIARSICADFVRESEDDRMMNIITKALCTNQAQEEIEKYGINAIDCVEWLEKQSEQKHAWSEEDENIKNNICHIIRQYDKMSKRENQPCWYVGDCLLWMQNIKDRVQPQPKQEWSEEDERLSNAIYESIDFLCLGFSEDKLRDWLKSLKERMKGE